MAGSTNFLTSSLFQLAALAGRTARRVLARTQDKRLEAFVAFQAGVFEDRHVEIIARLDRLVNRSATGFRDSPDLLSKRVHGGSPGLRLDNHFLLLAADPARTSSRNCTGYVIMDLKITPSG